MGRLGSLEERSILPAYRTVWRWHFYAGLFCIPFVLWLSITGSIYLFKPQIDALIDRPFASLTPTGSRASAHAQVAAALAAVPGSRFNAYQLPADGRSAVQILVGRGDDVTRVYVDPWSLRILKTVDDESRFEERVLHLHGELLLGDRGSMIVELAASWAIVMILTGLFLWWPRNAKGPAGILYPRLGRDRRFWRDLHGVTGFYVSVFALFYLVSGLPWASSWGGMLAAARQLGVVSPIVQAWSTGTASEIAARAAANAMPDMPGMSGPGAAATVKHDEAVDLAQLDGLVPVVASWHLAMPVLIAPPSKADASWSARSEAQDRPERVTVQLDPVTGAVGPRRGFGQLALLDQAIAVGVAAHEGQLFAPLNQVVALATALALAAVCASGIVLWWSRRTPNVLGAPAALRRQRLSPWLIGAIAALAIVLPLLGISLVCMLCLERLLLRRIPPIRDFLGLREAAR